MTESIPAERRHTGISETTTQLGRVAIDIRTHAFAINARDRNNQTHKNRRIEGLLIYRGNTQPSFSPDVIPNIVDHAKTLFELQNSDKGNKDHERNTDSEHKRKSSVLTTSALLEQLALRGVDDKISAKIIGHTPDLYATPDPYATIVDFYLGHPYIAVVTDSHKNEHGHSYYRVVIARIWDK